MYGGVQNCDSVFKNASTLHERGRYYFILDSTLSRQKHNNRTCYITYSKKMYLKYTLGYCFLISSKNARNWPVMHLSKTNSKAYFTAASGRGYNVNGRGMFPIGAQSKVGGLPNNN